ncbi:RcnB family protein [Leclercia adecarboxylata]
MLKGLPQYQGYEWRRVGSDIVLVAVTTGIVYTILQGVLN